MELELVSVRRWFSRLQSMQSCAADISHDTPQSLAGFYSARHAAILAKPQQQGNFAFCVFRNTGISVADPDFANTLSFHELLDEAHRNLRIAVRGLVRAVAIAAGSVPQAEDPQKFETRKSKDVFETDAKIVSLCGALASVMPIFPQSEAAQTSFKALLQKDATTVKDAIDATVKE